MLDLDELEGLDVYCKSLNRFGEVVGYYPDTNTLLVELDFVHEHEMATKGERSTAAEIDISDATFFGEAVI